MTTSCLENCPSPHDRALLLRERAMSFAKAFVEGKLPDRILKEHFTSSPKITEHGHQRKELPFLGKTFESNDGCLDYFDKLGQTLGFELAANTFPGPNGFIVDPEAYAEGVPQDIHNSGLVCVVGKAKFKSVQTGQSWNAQFQWRLSDFDAAGMIGHWEIWADPLSAYLAVRGELS